MLGSFYSLRHNLRNMRHVFALPKMFRHTIWIARLKVTIGMKKFGMQVDTVLTSPLARAKETAQPIANLQALAGYPTPTIEENPLLIDRDWGTFEGRLASEVILQCTEWIYPPRTRKLYLSLVKWLPWQLGWVETTFDVFAGQI